jgi:hypothetical protein
MWKQILVALRGVLSTNFTQTVVADCTQEYN